MSVHDFSNLNSFLLLQVEDLDFGVTGEDKQLIILGFAELESVDI